MDQEQDEPSPDELGTPHKSSRKSHAQSQSTSSGFDLVIPINLNNPEDAKAWKFFVEKLAGEWRLQDRHGEYFFVEENYMEWDVGGKDSFNAYIPFSPQYFRHFGCPSVAEDRIELSDAMHQMVWRLARRYLGHRVRRSNVGAAGGHTPSLDTLEQLRAVVYTLPPLQDNTPNGLWMWQLYEAGGVTARPPERIAPTFRPIAPVPPSLTLDMPMHAEPRVRMDSANSHEEPRSMIHHPHPGMATSTLPTIVPSASHLGYTLPPDSFGLFPIIAVSHPRCSESFQR
jgi:hypothetical protein